MMEDDDDDDIDACCLLCPLSADSVRTQLIICERRLQDCLSLRHCNLTEDP